jgi:hypothetical protein
VTRGANAARRRASLERIGVGMLGYAFVGKAHSRAFHEVTRLDPPLVPELAPEAHEMWAAAEQAGVVHMCGFN